MMTDNLRSIKQSLASISCSAAHTIGVAKFIEPWLGGAGSIFMLHSVLPTSDYLPRENLHTSVKFLEAVLSYYRSIGMRFVTLSDALVLAEKKEPQRFGVITFDDGYRNNISVVLPLLKKYEVPFTIFVTNSFVNRSSKMDYWWGQLRHFVYDNNHADFEFASKKIKMESASDKIKAYKEIRSMMMSQPRHVRDVIDKYISSSEALERDAMDASEVRNCAKESLIDLGAHTFSHQPLATMGVHNALSDILKNKLWLEGSSEKKVSHFAYPFGDVLSCGAREFHLAREAGFEAAFTSRIGNILLTDPQKRFDIPRIRFVGSVENISFLECQRSGLISVL